MAIATFMLVAMLGVDDIAIYALCTWHCCLCFGVDDFGMCAW